LAIILYYFSVKASFFINHTSGSAYLSGFADFQFNVNYIKTLSASFFDSVFKYYFYDIGIFLSGNIPLVFLFFCGFFLALYLSLMGNKFIIGFILVVGLFFSPFILNLLSVDRIPTRALIALPLSVSFFCLLILEFSARYKKVYMFLVALALVGIMYNFISLSKLMLVSSNAWRSDQQIAQMMVYTIQNNKHYEKSYLENGVVPTHLVGYLDKEENQFNREVENIGKSFFKWGANELQNINVLFASVGYGQFKFADLSDVRLHLDDIRFMPSWPALGSIQFYNGVAIIKASDYTEAQWKLLCLNQNGVVFDIDACKIRYNPQSIPFFIGGSENNGRLLFDGESQPYERTLNIYPRDKNSIVAPMSEDSQIILPNIDYDADYFRLEIYGDYAQDDFIDIYFKTNTQKNYLFNNVFRIYVPKGSFKISIRLPAYIFKDNLRIDPTIHNQKITGFGVKVKSD
jgi:hypothetical protein